MSVPDDLGGLSNARPVFEAPLNDGDELVTFSIAVPVPIAEALRRIGVRNGVPEEHVIISIVAEYLAFRA